MTYSRDCRAFKKIYGAVYKIIVTFVGMDQIKWKNGNESSRTHANQILISRNRPKQTSPFFV